MTTVHIFAPRGTLSQDCEGERAPGEPILSTVTAGRICYRHYFSHLCIPLLASHFPWVEIEMLGLTKLNRRHNRIIREDRKCLEARVRRFLSDYLSATDLQKTRFYEVVAGAAAGCHPERAISYLENIQVAEMTAESASAVVRRRVEMGKDSHDTQERFITDAYATTALAYRRAAGTYVDDERMQQLGTAAVHLLTIANSAMTSMQKDG